MNVNQLKTIFGKQQEVNKRLREIRQDLEAHLNLRQDNLLLRGQDLADRFEKRQQATANRIKDSFAKVPAEASKAYHSPNAHPRFQRKVTLLTEPKEYKSSPMPKKQKELLEKMTTLQMEVCYEADKVFSCLQSLDSSCTVENTESSTDRTPELRALPFKNKLQVDTIEMKSENEDRPTPKNILNFLAADSEQW